jgi:hypothetical protein
MWSNYRADNISKQGTSQDIHFAWLGINNKQKRGGKNIHHASIVYYRVISRCYGCWHRLQVGKYSYVIRQKIDSLNIWRAFLLHASPFVDELRDILNFLEVSSLFLFPYE